MANYLYINIRCIIFVLTFTALSNPCKVWSQEKVATPDEISSIFRKSMTLHGYTKSISVKTDKCRIYIEKRFSRICGNEFDSSLALSEGTLIDLRDFAIPFIDKKKGSIILYAKKITAASGNPENNKITKYCDGSVLFEGRYTFRVSVKQRDLLKIYNIISKYIVKNCR